MVPLVCPGAGWFGSSVVAELTCIDLISRRLMTALEPTVNLAARADAAANVRAKRLGDAVQPTFRALADDDGVGHRLTASEPLPCDFPGDRPFPSGPARRFDIGALFAQKADAGLDRYVEPPPRTCATNLPSGSAEKTSADGAENFVARPTEHGSRLVEVQEPTRTKHAPDGAPTREDALDGERSAGGVLPPDTNSGSGMRLHALSLARLGGISHKGRTTSSDEGIVSERAVPVHRGRKETRWPSKASGWRQPPNRPSASPTP